MRFSPAHCWLAPRFAILGTLGLLAACSRLSPTPCDALEGSVRESQVRAIATAARLVVKRTGEATWRTHGVEDGESFRVEAVESRGELRTFRLRPQWMTDARPLLVVCSREGDLLAAGGFPTPDNALLRLLGEELVGDSALIAGARVAARLLDPNTETPLEVASSGGASSDDSAPSTRERVASSDNPVDPPIVRDSTGATVALSLQSAATWSAIGGRDVWVLRLRVDTTGRPIWADRLIRNGPWLLSKAGPDSVRVSWK